MKKKYLINTIHTSTATAIALLGTGCASIIHGGPRTLSVSSQPPGAKATVSKDSGETVSINTTPFTVSLEPKKAFFKGQAYNIRLELAGYQSVDVAIRPEISGWYVANLLFGGLIGMLIVDPATGSMWNLSPDQIQQPLTQNQAALIRSGNGFVVVLESQVTPGERAHMVKIN